MRILMVRTGGTIAQKPDSNGILVPSTQNYLDDLPEIHKLANISDYDLGSIDSTDMPTISSGSSVGRDRIANIIVEKSEDYDGFVVVHGTDTMVETAAALNYMVQGLGKPIVLTGSQKPFWSEKTDAKRNLIHSIECAKKDLAETVIVFGGKILRGVRAKKVDSKAYDAFDSPGFVPLGSVNSDTEEINLTEDTVKRSERDNLTLFTNFDTRVYNHSSFSGLSDRALLNFAVENEEIKGIMIAGYGTGSIPDFLLDDLIRAREMCKPVLVYTRCEKGGSDVGVYEAGSRALEVGVIPTGNMRPEAISQKFMYLLGMANTNGIVGEDLIDYVREEVKVPIGRDIS